MIIIILIGVYYIVANISAIFFAIDETKDETETKYFYQKWKYLVEDSQDFTIGKILMNVFYTIPLGIAIISFIRAKLLKKT